MEKLPISLCVITRNSSDRIKNMLLRHREFIDEILVIDQESTDNTYKEAWEVADLVIKKRCKGASDPDRNWLYALAKNPWVLYLDDDEYLDAELIRVLPELVKDKPDIYWLKERNLVDGIDIADIYGKEGFARDDFHPRLFKKGHVIYVDQQTQVDHTYPQCKPGSNVAFVNYYIIHDRTLEKIKSANRNRNKVATPQQIEMQEKFIRAVEDFISKKK